jgi:chromosome segregation ATPase
MCEQLITLTSKLSQAEASQQAAATRLGEAEERVADMKQQLVTSARERAATLLALAQTRQQHEELQTEHSRQTELHRAAVAEHEARRARDDAQVEEMARIISHLQECARLESDEKGEREKREKREKRERLAAEKYEEKDETIEALTRQSSEYRATVMHHEESLAELRAQCSQDAALVARLRVRVEQQEGLLVEQAAQLCQNEAHIAQLESELQQQQACRDNLGTPGKSDSERGLKGGSEGMSQGHIASGGRGGGLEGGGAGKGDGEAAARRVALAESYVASLEQLVRDLKADKHKLAGLLQVCVL